MIDYEKLKIAHEFAKQITEFSGMRFDIIVSYSDEDTPMYSFIDYRYSKDTGWTEDIDDFISALKEGLTQDKPKPKYEDMAWFIHKDEIKGYKPNGFEDGMYYFGPLLGWWDEELLYPSKQALIENQIQYWSSLKKHDLSTHNDDMLTPSTQNLSSCCSVHAGTAEECAKEECQHKSDGSLYHVNGLYEVLIDEAPLPFSPSERYKCKHCGEFYK